jgi:hypothetical protein
VSSKCRCHEQCDTVSNNSWSVKEPGIHLQLRDNNIIMRRRPGRHHLSSPIMHLHCATSFLLGSNSSTVGALRVKITLLITSSMEICKGKACMEAVKVDKQLCAPSKDIK